MGRAPCCDKSKVKKGPWSPEEDATLRSHIQQHGTGGNWIALPNKIGLKRCGKSCRLRWLNYLRPNLKHGGYTEDEDNLICSLYVTIGSRWSIIAAQLPGRTDNDIKNYWNTRLKKKLLGKQRRRITTNKSTAAAAAGGGYDDHNDEEMMSLQVPPYATGNLQLLQPDSIIMPQIQPPDFTNYNHHLESSSTSSDFNIINFDGMYEESMLFEGAVNPSSQIWGEAALYPPTNYQEIFTALPFDETRLLGYSQ